MASTYLEKALDNLSPNLTQTEQIIGNYFLENETMIAHQTLSQISKIIGVSESTIFKFVKRLGFSGFQDFKIKLALNTKDTNYPLPVLTSYTDITDDDTALTVSKKIIQSNIALLENMYLNISEKELEKAIKLLLNSKMIHFMGLGASGAIALDSYQKFLRTSLRANFVFDSHMQLADITKLNETDVAILYSHSGKTIEVIRYAEALKEVGAKIIVMTGNPHSQLLRYADAHFIFESQESKFKSEALAARILYLTMSDILYVCIMHFNAEENTVSMQNIRNILKDVRI